MFKLFDVFFTQINSKYLIIEKQVSRVMYVNYILIFWLIFVFSIFRFSSENVNKCKILLSEDLKPYYYKFSPSPSSSPYIFELGSA